MWQSNEILILGIKLDYFLLPLKDVGKLKKNKPIKIARIATISESLTSILKCISECQKAGFEVDIICSKSTFGDYLKNQLGFNVIYCEIPREISILRDLKALAQLFWIFITNRYDIVHSNTPKAGLVSALASFFSFRKVRLHTFTGQRWATLMPPLRTVLKIIDRVIIFLNTKCYADSRTQIDFLVQEKVAGQGKIDCLGEGSFGGIDLEKFSSNMRDKARQEISAKYNVPENLTWVLYVGRIVKDKGIEELIEAHQSIIKKTPYHLLLVGPFEEGDPVSDNTKQIILSDKFIHHLGFQNDPAYFMKAADFLCLPSYREGFGTVVLEAAACGIPSVGTDIPGLRDAIVANETGLLIPPKNSDKLAQAILTFINDKSYREALGVKAHRRTENKFSHELYSKLQIADYNKLLKLN